MDIWGVKLPAIIGSDMETMSGFTGIVPILFSRSSDICLFLSFLSYE